MRRSALPVLVLACVVVAAVLAWVVVQRMFRASDAEPPTPPVAEVRTQGAFTKIDVAGQAEVEIVQADVHEVLVEAAPRDQGQVRTSVSGGTLRIATGNRSAWGTLHGDGRVPRIVVKAPAIESITAAGSTTITSGSLAVPSLRIAASGTTTLRIEGLKTDLLRVAGSGAVKADLSGRATEQSISLSGAGTVNAPHLRSESAKVGVSGAGHVVVNAEKSLRVSLSGAGSVEYLGDPEVKQSVSGLGTIKRRDAEPLPTRARLPFRAA